MGTGQVLYQNGASRAYYGAREGGCLLPPSCSATGASAWRDCAAAQGAGACTAMEELLGALNALTGATRISEAIPGHVDALQFSGDVLGFEAEAAAA